LKLYFTYLRTDLASCPLPQALQLLFAEEAGDWYAASASPALHQAAATAYDALLAARCFPWVSVLAML